MEQNDQKNRQEHLDEILKTQKVEGEDKAPFIEPKLTFVEPKLVKQGDVAEITAGFFNTFSP